MPIYNSIEYSGNYLKMSGSLWHYRGGPNDNIIQSESFNTRLT